MEGYVDLHCHLLPDADDGSKNVEDSLACLKDAAAAGFTDVVLTRHRMTGYYDLPAEEARRRRVELAAHVAESGINITLHDGAEHYMDDTFLARLDAGIETLAGGAGVLVEIPLMRIPPFLSEMSFRIRLKGFTPILAHVERYIEVVENPKKARALADMGFLLQINLGSLGGFYGRSVAKAARRVIDEGLAFCASSDCHGPSMSSAVYSDGIRELSKFGDRAVEALLEENPRKILRGESL